MLSLRKNKSYVIASVVTLFVIGLIVFSGPAQAFAANLSAFSDATPKQADSITAQFDIDMNTAERADVSSIDVYIDGVNTCSFDSVGNVSGSCDELTLEKLTSTAEWGYGYGYGYGYGQELVSSKLSYTLTLDTTDLVIGEHLLHLVVSSNNNVPSMTSETQSIIVSSQGDAEYAAIIDVSELNGTINDDLDASINLVFEANGTGSIIVESYSEMPDGTTAFSIPALGIYLVVDDSGITSGTISNETELRVYYTDAELAAAGLDESTLKLYFYNITTGTWELPLSSGVNTVDNYVWAKTDHFSSWGVFGSSVAVSSSSSSSGIGGRGTCETKWTCSEWTACSENGLQTRTCSYPTGYCAPANAKPSLSQACTANSAESNAENINANEGKSSGITGAVIGALGTGGFIATIVFVLALAGAFVAVRLKRQAQK